MLVLACLVGVLPARRQAAIGEGIDRIGHRRDVTIGPEKVGTARVPAGEFGLVGILAVEADPGKADNARFAVFAVDRKTGPCRRTFRGSSLAD